RPQVEYYRAWATFQSGQETNALTLFTNFVSQFPNDSLAPLAQWWVGDYYFRRGDFVPAEKNYKTLFQTWPKSELALDASMMAGRAAVGAQNYSGAIEYFTNLTLRVDCPPKLKAQALLQYGGALTLADSGDTNKSSANLLDAIRVFGKVCDSYPTNEA